MRNKIYLYVVGSLMIIVGLLRGIGGLFSLTDGIETVSENTVPWKTTVAGIDLLLVALALIVSAGLLFIKRNKTAWTVSWISLCLFIIGGLVNGFLLFGKPQIDGQIINWSICILTGLLLLFGKKALNKGN
jgi:K+-transporting ATPase A subunit